MSNRIHSTILLPYHDQRGAIFVPLNAQYIAEGGICWKGGELTPAEHVEFRLREELEHGVASLFPGKAALRFLCCL